ncbi:MAG: nicotinamide mononucleotide transporter [Clostridia bacterium]|nr:nicotinamide mononucleotide transporter [Clostridia bacterium]
MKMEKTNKNVFKRMWDYFTTYEKTWFLGIMGLSIVVTILFPSSVEDLAINPWMIMSLYLLDIFLSLMCELLIAKQSKWNFIVSLGIEITEIVTLILLAERFATMAVTIFFWIPCDIISFVNWHMHKDKENEELTVVRELKGWQEALIIAGIVVWTFGIGYLLTVISPDGLLPTNSFADNLVCYLDAACSAVGICNGLFILFRFKEQWIAWYICAALETIMNIVMGQWVLLVLKLGYFTNTTYGYIKWTKYIKAKESNKSVTYINLKKANA